MNPDLVPEVLIDKNGKAVTRKVSLRKVRKLGLKAAPIPPQPDPKIAEGKAIRAELISVYKATDDAGFSVSAWNRAIHEVSDKAAKLILNECSRGPVQARRAIELTCNYARLDPFLPSTINVLPLFDDSGYEPDFIGDLVQSAWATGVFPDQTDMTRLKGNDRAYLEAVLVVSGAMFHERYARPSREHTYDHFAASVMDEDLRELLRERPEVASEIAVLAKERGPELSGDTARTYLDMGAKVLSDGLL
jgi:hypothetical protein